jgi:hypothetical protein
MAENRAHDFSENAHRLLPMDARLCERAGTALIYGDGAAKLSRMIRTCQRHAGYAAKLSQGEMTVE